MVSNKPIKKYLVKGDFVKFCIDDDIIISVDYGKNYVVVVTVEKAPKGDNDDERPIF